MVVITDLETFYPDFDWPKDFDENLKHEIKYIIKSNNSLAKNNTKNKVSQLLWKYKHENDINDTKNSKTNEPHKFAFQYLSVYYT